MTVVGDDLFVSIAVMVVERDIKLVGKGVDYGGADAEAGKGAGAGHKLDFGDVLPGLVILGEFVVDVLK